MEKADTILYGGTVVTMNAAFDLIPDGAVAIRGTDIAAVGTRADVLAGWQSDTLIDCAGRIIMPGLVNAHTHVPMTLLRGLADDLRLDVWLFGYIMPTEREFVNPEFCRLGTSLACAEMIRSGITSFADMYYFEADVAEATAEAGLRGVLGETVLKFPAPDAESYEDSLAYCRGFIEKWRGHPLITPAVAPHAPYSLTEEMLRRCVDLAREFDVPLLIHLAETKQEIENSLSEFGTTVITHMNNVGLFNAKVLAAHCVHVDQNEIHVLHDTDTSVAHCPTSNLKIASGIAPITQMLKSDLTVGIGTDGTASNNDLDMFEEVRLTAILAKTAANDPTALPARQALLMATRQGAAALFMDDITGSLEAGKRADVIVLDDTTLHNTPHFDYDPDAIYSRIIYAAKSTDVRHVLCNGRWLMRDRVLLTVNEQSIIAQAREYSRRVDAFISQREKDMLSKLLAIGGLSQSESFEVQVKATLRDESALDALFKHPDVEIVKSVHYRQYDTYFLFADDADGRVRYREDARLDKNGEVEAVRARLTFTMPTKEREFHSTILLSHSRFIADANQSLRFYREYFRPVSERTLNKDRWRWHIYFRGVLYYVNVDRVLEPALPGLFIELKSRTWSARDAEAKAQSIAEMLGILEIAPDSIVGSDYLEMENA
ncbi:MAG: amidohydrolase family protein [Anaerolineae bacterium]|nr:amidohydrolase family protein [Anaerolineae bacterium]